MPPGHRKSGKTAVDSPPKPRLRVGEVRGLMLAAGWTGARLATESGVDAAYLGKLLRGGRVLGLSAATRLVAAFERKFGTRITLDAIVEYDGAAPADEPPGFGEPDLDDADLADATADVAS